MTLGLKGHVASVTVQRLKGWQSLHLHLPLINTSVACLDIRLLEFLELWMRRYPSDIYPGARGRILSLLMQQETNQELINRIKLIFLSNSLHNDFSSTCVPPEQGLQSKELKLKQSSESDFHHDCYKEEQQRGDICPLHDFASSSFRYGSLLSFSSSFLAKSLTSYEYEIFSSITPREFLNQNWQSEDNSR